MQVSGDSNLEQFSNLKQFEISMDEIAKIGKSSKLPEKPITQNKLNAIIKQFNVEIATKAIESADSGTLASVNIKLNNILTSYKNQQSPIRKKVNDVINKIMCKILKVKEWDSQSQTQKLIKLTHDKITNKSTQVELADYKIKFYESQITEVSSSIKILEKNKSQHNLSVKKKYEIINKLSLLNKKLKILNEVHEKIQKLKDTLSLTKAEKNDKISNYEKAIKELQTKKDDLNSKIQFHTDEIAKVEQEKVSLSVEQRKESLKSQNNYPKQESTQSRENFKELVKAWEEAQDQRVKQNGKKLKNCEETIKYRDNEISSLEEQIKKLDQEISDLQQEISYVK